MSSEADDKLTTFGREVVRLRTVPCAKTAQGGLFQRKGNNDANAPNDSGRD